MFKGRQSKGINNAYISTILAIIVQCDEAGYISLRNDLIEDIKPYLNDKQLKHVLELVNDGNI